MAIKGYKIAILNTYMHVDVGVLAWNWYDCRLVCTLRNKFIMSRVSVCEVCGWFCIFVGVRIVKCWIVWSENENY